MIPLSEHQDIYVFAHESSVSLKFIANNSDELANIIIKANTNVSTRLIFSLILYLPILFYILFHLLFYHIFKANLKLSDNII